MDIKELEIKRTEEYIINQFPPLFKSFILSSPKINKVVEKYENLIISFMNENGSVNGELLSNVILEKYPNIAQWVNIPRYNFYLKDEVEKIFNFLIQRGQ